MISEIIIFLVIWNISYSVDLYEDYESSHHSNPVTLQNLEFEPVVPFKEKEKIILTKNFSCEEFPQYTLNCTMEAAVIYNSDKKSPPMPAKLNNWCRAIRHLTNCAIDWNSECKDVTESHFNEESIKGHMHVVNEVCDNESFLTQYEQIPTCIAIASSAWEECYTAFKSVVDQQKNGSQEWTHYMTHFYLCCARTRFRRCTLDVLFNTHKCEKDQAIVLQKFSVIVSEGDVSQDCENYVAYAACPGGDPRPDKDMMKRLMNEMMFNAGNVSNFPYVLWCTLVLLCLLK